MWAFKLQDMPSSTAYCLVCQYANILAITVRLSSIQYGSALKKPPGLYVTLDTVTVKAGRKAFGEFIVDHLGATNTGAHQRYPLGHKS